MPKESNEEILHTLADMNEAIGGRFDRVDEQLADMQTQLNRIETIILQEHARRIEALERKAGLRS